MNTTISSLLLVVFLYSTIVTPHVSASVTRGSFLQCLSHSRNATRISEFVYSPANSSYATILDTPIQNLRFLDPSAPKPLFIITPLTQSHIQASILCARTHGLQIRVRSGGHDFEGLSYVADAPFVILDLLNFQSIDIDIKSQTAWVEPGATLGQLYYKIAQKSKTLAFPGGLCPSVGSGGHITGGGWGLLLRKYGLAADQAVDVRLIDVNGRILNRKSMGEDLFWAIRGGGAASFGVVVAWRIQLVPVPENVTVFDAVRSLEQNATKIIYRWQAIAHKLPNELMTLISITTANSSSGEPTAVARIRGLFLGGKYQLLQLMRERFPELDLLHENTTEMSWIESILHFQDLPKETPLEVLLNRTASVKNAFKAKSDYVRYPISEGGLEGLWQRLLQTDIGLVQVDFEAFGGRMDEVPASATPFPHRAGIIYQIVYFKAWTNTGTAATEESIDWMRKLYDYMAPYVSQTPRRAYLNYRDLDIGTNNRFGHASYRRARAWGRKYFVDNFDRLVRVKTIFDPHNFFRNEQSIPSLTAGPRF